MPPSDNRHLRAQAAARRAADTRKRARAALQRLDRDGDPITFTAVAAAANVSRSWLYRDPDLRAEIARLRDAHRPAAGPSVPAAQRATHDSLQRRVEALLDANHALRAENTALREQVALALGEQRAAPSTRPPRDGRVIGPLPADPPEPRRRHVLDAHPRVSGLLHLPAPEKLPLRRLRPVCAHQPRVGLPAAGLAGRREGAGGRFPCSPCTGWPGWCPAVPRQPRHVYAADLDLWGPGSLFQRIDVTHTVHGARCLSQWLSQAAEPRVVKERQAAVQELAPMVELRQELEAAARVDGAGRLTVLRTIYLPLATQGMAAVAIFSFVTSWNEYLFASVLVADNELKTLPVASIREQIKAIAAKEQIQIEDAALDGALHMRQGEPVRRAQPWPDQSIGHTTGGQEVEGWSPVLQVTGSSVGTCGSAPARWAPRPRSDRPGRTRGVTPPGRRGSCEPIRPFRRREMTAASVAPRARASTVEGGVAVADGDDVRVRPPHAAADGLVVGVHDHGGGARAHAGGGMAEPRDVHAASDDRGVPSILAMRRTSGQRWSSSGHQARAPSAAATPAVPRGTGTSAHCATAAPQERPAPNATKRM